MLAGDLRLDGYCTLIVLIELIIMYGFAWEYTQNTFRLVSFSCSYFPWALDRFQAVRLGSYRQMMFF